MRYLFLCVGRMGWLEHDPLEWKKVKSFGLVSVAFVAAVFTNMKTLQVQHPLACIILNAHAWASPSGPFGVLLVQHFFTPSLSLPLLCVLPPL